MMVFQTQGPEHLSWKQIVLPPPGQLWGFVPGNTLSRDVAQEEKQFSVETQNHQGTSAGSSTGYPQSPSGRGLAPDTRRDEVLPLPQEPPHRGEGGQQHPALQHLPLALQPRHRTQVVRFLSIKDGNNETKASSSPEEIHTEARACVMAHVSRIPSIKQQFPSQS